MPRVHDTIRNLLATMCKAAGLACVKEPTSLLPDNVNDRSGDLYITGERVKGIEQTNHAIDLTCPLADSQWSTLTIPKRTKRATVVGMAGMEAENRKLNDRGSAFEQRARGNTDNMAQRCQANNIHFWPVPLEGDGVASEIF